MQPRPQNPPFLPWIRLALLLWVTTVRGWAQQTPAVLPAPDTGLGPRPEARSPKSGLPQNPAPLPDEPNLIPAIPPARPAPAPIPPPTFPPAFSMITRPAAPTLPLLPLPPAFATPPTEQQVSTAPLLRERFVEAAPPGSRLNVRERAAEVPLGLQRHPGRDFAPATDTAGFSLRLPGTGEVAAQLNFGLQTEIRYSHNVDAVPTRFAREDTVMETTPQVRLQVGDPPGPRRERSTDSENYLQLEYLPTVRQLLGNGTSRTLQRTRGELGRANPVSTAAIRYEYDENLFSVGGLDSPEDSFTLFELAPRLEYRPSVRTLLRAEGTYDRIKVQGGATDRADYILDVSLTWEYSAKTLLGTGVEVRHIEFDEADLGKVDYEYSYLALTWRATAKLLLQARGGLELRQLDRPAESGNQGEPATTILLNWVPSDSTRVNAGFRLRNQPSVTGRGDLYRDARFGLDATHDLRHDFYVRGEIIVRQRDYETGRRESEFTVRPALGYRPLTGRAVDNFQIELFYQYRNFDSSLPSSDFEQVTVGLQSSISF